MRNVKRQQRSLGQSVVFGVASTVALYAIALVAVWLLDASWLVALIMSAVVMSFAVWAQQRRGGSVGRRRFGP